MFFYIIEDQGKKKPKLNLTLTLTLILRLPVNYLHLLKYPERYWSPVPKVQDPGQTISERNLVDCWNKSHGKIFPAASHV